MLVCDYDFIYKWDYQDARRKKNGVNVNKLQEILQCKYTIKY